jgi:hypothetical protein
MIINALCLWSVHTDEGNGVIIRDLSACCRAMCILFIRVGGRRVYRKLLNEFMFMNWLPLHKSASPPISYVDE